MKRMILAVVPCLFLASLIFSDHSYGGVKETGKPFAGTELNVVLMGKHDQGIADLLPQFSTETGIQVNITTAGMTDLQAKLGTEFASGGSSYDVTEMTWEAAQGYARANYLYGLDDFVKKYNINLNQYTNVYIKKHMIQYAQTENLLRPVPADRYAPCPSGKNGDIS